MAEFCSSFNASGAAVKAGYAKRNADVASAKILQNVKVQAAIARRLKPRMARLGLTLDNMLEKLRSTAFLTTGVEDANGDLLPVTEWPKGDRQAIL